MKAAVCREFRQSLAIEQVELAEPRPGEVRVRIKACAICHSDLLFLAGAWAASCRRWPATRRPGSSRRWASGSSGSGRAITSWSRSCAPAATVPSAPAASASCARPGCRSICARRCALADGSPIRQGLRTGAFAEQVVVDASQVALIPPEVPLDSAALLACGVITGVGAVLNTAAMRPGSHVATIGTGGVGLNCVQGAALGGARTNIAIDLADREARRGAQLGASHAINPAREDARAAVRALTDGRGADYVFVAAGSAAAIEQGVRLLRRGGTLVVAGMTADGVRVHFEAVDIADHALRILGSKMGSVRMPLDIEMLADWYLKGRLKLDELITGRYPLEQINEAIAAAAAGEALRNVITF